jgi:diguanylate cyclase (GGDEF)-like protein
MPSKTPHQLSRPGLLWLLPAALALLVLAFELGMLDQTDARLRWRAQAQATDYAARLAERLRAQFATLDFIGTLLVDADAKAPLAPPDGVLPALRKVLERQPPLPFALLAPDGRTVWSSRALTSPGADYRAMPGRIDDQYGVCCEVDPELGRIVMLRVRIADAQGRTRFYVAAPSRVETLLDWRGDAAPPWTFSVTDPRDGARLDAAGAAAAAPPSSASATPLSDLPFAVRAHWPPSLARQLWTREGRARWALEAILLGCVTACVALLRSRQRRRWRREDARRRALLEDPLTGLASRLAFEQQLGTLAAQVHDDEQLMVAVIDIYRFTRLNQQWGRAAGDAVLLELARRLRALLQQTRAARGAPPALQRPLLLARVGPDSMALAYVGILPAQVNALIEVVLAVMHMPFCITDHQSQTLSAALGCALYPDDTPLPARLLGTAEAAVFDHSERRQQQFKADIDPYGGEAAARLHWANRLMLKRLRKFSQVFVRKLQSDPANRDLIQLLSQAGREHHERLLQRHVAALLSPGLNAQQHREQAQRVGRVHAALGIPARAAVRGLAGLRQTFVALCQRLPGRLSQRQLLLGVLTQRLDAELAFQQEGADQLQLDIHAVMQDLGRTLHAMTRRVDMLDAALMALARLPFVLCAAAYARDANGRFIVEAQTPSHLQLIEARPELRLAGFEPGEVATHALARSWMAATIEDEALDADRELAATEACSMVALPLCAADGQVVLCFQIYGCLPLLFRSTVMLQALDSLRQMAARHLARNGATAPLFVDAATGADWRRQLFDTGLQMFMQPIVDFRAGCCNKVEALARLRLDDGALVTPDRFLSILSQRDLDRLFVDGLQQALRVLRAWEDDGLQLDLSFNLPPSTLRNPECVAWVGAALARQRIAASRLTLEVLESHSFAETEAILRHSSALKELGVHLALDDLGAGYSSLLRLRRLPVDLVKIDQGLVRGIADDQRGAPLVGGLVELARRLQLKITIEGLETPALVDFAQFLGADFGQGWGIARAMPAQDIPAWVRGFALPPFSGRHPLAAAGPQTGSGTAIRRNAA